MEIFLIRHTRVAVNKSTCYGHSDVDLAECFQEELNELNNKLKSFEFSSVYSSPLKRCFKLAQSIKCPRATIVDPRLKEMNFGEWELKEWDTIDSLMLNNWMNDFVNIATPGGESYKDLFARSTAFFNELICNKDAKVLVVTHGGVIRSILSHVLHIPLEKSFTLQIDYGKISKIKVVGENNIIVEHFNN